MREAFVEHVSALLWRRTNPNGRVVEVRVVEWRTEHVGYVLPMYVESPVHHEPHLTIEAVSILGSIHPNVNPIRVVCAAYDVDVTEWEHNTEMLRLGIATISTEDNLLDLVTTVCHLESFHPTPCKLKSSP